MQKAAIGGVLSIVAGAIGILIGLFYLAYPLFLGFIFDSLEEEPAYIAASGTDPFMLMMWLMFGAVFFFYLLLGALSIAGGVCAIKKKAWGLALAGAIASSMSFYYVGIAAVVLVAMAQPEFNKPAVVTVPQTV